MKRSLLDSFILFGSGVLCALIIGVLYHFVVNSPYFKLKEIVIQGETQHLSKRDLVKLAEIPFGRNLFVINLYKIRQNIERFPWIKDVQLRRNFPDGLSIYVKEHKPLFVLKTNLEKNPQKFEYYLGSDEGVLFKKMSQTNEYHLPFVTGFITDKLNRYPVYYARHIEEAFHFINFFQEREWIPGFNIVEVQYSVVDGITLVGKIANQPESLEIYFGKDHLTSKMERLNEFLQIANKENTVFKKISLHVEDKVFSRL